MGALDDGAARGWTGSAGADRIAAQEGAGAMPRRRDAGVAVEHPGSLLLAGGPQAMPSRDSVPRSRSAALGRRRAAGGRVGQGRP